MTSGVNLRRSALSVAWRVVDARFRFNTDVFACSPLAPLNNSVDQQQTTNSDRRVFERRAIGAGDKPLKNLASHERPLELQPRWYARDGKRGEIVASPSPIVPSQFFGSKE